MAIYRCFSDMDLLTGDVPVDMIHEEQGLAVYRMFY
jgi:hypothetical protein